jgi:hypothetical protein
MFDRRLTSLTKSRLMTLIGLLALTLSMVGFMAHPMPVRAASVCSAIPGSSGKQGGFITQSIAVNPGDTITVTANAFIQLTLPGQPTQSGGGQVSGVASVAGIATVAISNEIPYVYIITICRVGGPGPQCPGMYDGRINNDPALDCGAPVAIYPAGSVDIYAINPSTSEGQFVSRVEYDSTSDTTQTLFEGTNPFTGQPILVTELPGGLIQLNTAYADGKPYIVEWPADDPLQLVHVSV